MAEDTKMSFQTSSGRHYTLNLHFPAGRGNPENLPSRPGVYAEIQRNEKCITIRQSKNMKGRSNGHSSWARKPDRDGRIADVAKKWGVNGIECYVICDAPGMADADERKDVKKRMVDWCQSPECPYDDMNG